MFDEQLFLRSLLLAHRQHSYA